MNPGRAAIVSTVKAPIGVLRPWIIFHLNSGIERFFLFLDDDGDSVGAQLEAIEQVQVVRCTPEYWSRANGAMPETVPERQKINVNRGMEMAREAGCDWVAHVDCDELIRPLRPLAGILAGTRASALKMTVLEAVSERFEHPGLFEPRLFKAVPSRKQALSARLLGCRGAFRFGEYFRGHTESKMLVRLDGTIERMGIHKPLEHTGECRFEVTEEIQLLHFDGIGFDDWDRKWALRIEGVHRSSGFRPARMRQLEAYRQAARKGPQARAELFRKSQMIAPRETAVLKRLGLLKRIELDPVLFER